MRLVGIKYCQGRNFSWYDIYLLQYTKGETIYKAIQKHRIHKIETNIQNKKTNTKRILKNTSRVIRK
jgi:hypothetical protein